MKNIVDRKFAGQAETTAGFPFRSVFRQLARPIVQAAAYSLTYRWQPYSRLFLVSDSHWWVLSWEMKELGAIARQLNVELPHLSWLRYARKQAVFYSSQFILSENQWPDSSNRIGLAYFHGLPGTGVPEFDKIYRRLGEVHQQIHRIQVSHSEMRDVILNSGIAPEKVFLIPIGINLSYFCLQTPESRRKARLKYGIPESAVVIGSFQKDGVGWEDGLQPKLIKGPDVFLKTIEILKPRIPELFVLLSGPARGYVKAGLERLGVPYRHCLLQHYPEIGQLFQAIDLYIVASRQEGGPKAVLESMASGVPLVTTRVGQAMDLVQHSQNGWMVNVEDSEGLAYWAEYALTNSTELDSILRLGRQTAEANTYKSQIPLWHQFMNGFIQFNQGS